MRVSDTAIGVGAILFGIAVILYSRNFPSLENGYPGPSLFPIVLAVLFILAGVILGVQGLRRGERLFHFDASDLTASGMVKILLVIGLVVFYIFLSEPLGFHIVAPIILFVLMKCLNVSTRWGLVMSGGITVLIYGLFAKILMVPLPWGLWGW
jgi:putative tricarboxylic transport membrane protein